MTWFFYMKLALIYIAKLQIFYHHSFPTCIVLVSNGDNRADTVDSLANI